MTTQNRVPSKRGLRKSLVALLGDERGAAYAEAVIMLPVFMAIFAGYLVLFNAHSARLETMNNVRSATWQRSVEGCGLFDADEGCTGACADRIGSISGGIASDIPIVGGMLSSLVGPIVSEGATPVSYDGVVESANFEGSFGGGSATSSYQLVCNTRRQTVWDIVKAAACQILPDEVTSLMSSIC